MAQFVNQFPGAGQFSAGLGGDLTARLVPLVSSEHVLKVLDEVAGPLGPGQHLIVVDVVLPHIIGLKIE